MTKKTWLAISKKTAHKNKKNNLTKKTIKN
jgi:hypothetical protein